MCGIIIGVYEIRPGRLRREQRVKDRLGYAYQYNPIGSIRLIPNLAWEADDGEWHGFLYQASKWIDLGRHCYPTAINNQGEIIGQIPPGAASNAHARRFHRGNEPQAAVYREGKWTLLDVPFGDPQMGTWADFVDREPHLLQRPALILLGRQHETI